MWRLLSPLPPLSNAGTRGVQETFNTKARSLGLVLQEILKGMKNVCPLGSSDGQEEGENGQGVPRGD